MESVEYLEAANMASRYEQKGDWHLASNSWLCAEKVANNPRNSEWARMRFEFCECCAKYKHRIIFK